MRDRAGPFRFFGWLQSGSDVAVTKLATAIEAQAPPWRGPPPRHRPCDTLHITSGTQARADEGIDSIPNMIWVVTVLSLEKSVSLGGSGDLLCRLCHAPGDLGFGHEAPPTRRPKTSFRSCISSSFRHADCFRFGTRRKCRWPLRDRLPRCTDALEKATKPHQVEQL
jgi:hypothetical protein